MGWGEEGTRAGWGKGPRKGGCATGVNWVVLPKRGGCVASVNWIVHRSEVDRRKKGKCGMLEEGCKGMMKKKIKI